VLGNGCRLRVTLSRRWHQGRRQWQWQWGMLRGVLRWCGRRSRREGRRQRGSREGFRRQQWPQVLGGIEFLRAHLGDVECSGEDLGDVERGSGDRGILWSRGGAVPNGRYSVMRHTPLGLHPDSTKVCEKKASTELSIPWSARARLQQRRATHSAPHPWAVKKPGPSSGQVVTGGEQDRAT
jgi:hypothetical protein